MGTSCFTLHPLAYFILEHSEMVSCFKCSSSQPRCAFSTGQGNPLKLKASSQKEQGEAESVHRDLKVGFGMWEFSPLDLENPFLNNEAFVHLWHGDEDLIVPVTLQRYIAQQLPWIHYHEQWRSQEFI
ncbi:hypothetical protein ACLB2K_024183 [Fragaria x ananassa]